MLAFVRSLRLRALVVKDALAGRSHADTLDGALFHLHCIQFQRLRR